MEWSAVASVVVSTLVVMTGDRVVSSSDGVALEDGPDRGRILVSSASMGGAYSVWSGRSRPVSMMSSWGSVRIVMS